MVTGLDGQPKALHQRGARMKTGFPADVCYSLKPRDDTRSLSFLDCGQNSIRSKVGRLPEPPVLLREAENFLDQFFGAKSDFRVSAEAPSRGINAVADSIAIGPCMSHTAHLTTEEVR